MRNCWHEVPTKRPTFTELKSTLEHLLSQEIPYIELTIDQHQKYYFLPTVKSTTDSDENDNDDVDGDDGDDYDHDSDDDDDRGGAGVDDDIHFPKVDGSLTNTTEPRYKNFSQF